MTEENKKINFVPMQVGYSPECRGDIIKDGMGRAWMELWDVEHNVCNAVDEEVRTKLYEALELLKPYAFHHSDWQNKYKPNMEEVKEYLKK